MCKAVPSSHQESERWIRWMEKRTGEIRAVGDAPPSVDDASPQWASDFDIAKSQRECGAMKQGDDLDTFVHLILKEGRIE